MATPPRKHRLSPRARRALELLAGNALGVTEALMLAHGFTLRMLAGVVRVGLAREQRGVLRLATRRSRSSASRSRPRAGGRSKLTERCGGSEAARRSRSSASRSSTSTGGRSESDAHAAKVTWIAARFRLREFRGPADRNPLAVPRSSLV